MAHAAVLARPELGGSLAPPAWLADDQLRRILNAPPHRHRNRRGLRRRIAGLTNKLSDSARDSLRAGVFGGMDGSSSTLGLIAALAGAGAGPAAILTAAASGGIAGAASMGAGEYVSVKTDNERLTQAVKEVRGSLRSDPSRVRTELASLLVEQNPHLTPAAATTYAENLWSDPVLGERYHVATKLGEWPEDPAKPRSAAAASFGAFALGSILPTLPYLGVAAGVISGGAALPLAMAAGGLGLFGAGALSSRFSEGTWWKHGLRQLTAGAFTGGVSYAAAMGLSSVLGTSLAATALPTIAIAASVGMVALAGHRLLKRRKSRHISQQAARDLRAELAARPTVLQPTASQITTSRPSRWAEYLEMSQSGRGSPSATAPQSCPWLAGSPTPQPVDRSSSRSR